MTIPSRDWCPTCEERCQDHSSMCTVCGSNLVSRSSSTNLATTTTSSTANTSHAAAFRLMPDHMVDELRQASRDLARLVAATTANTNTSTNTTQAEDWQPIPDAILNPIHPTFSSSSSRPTDPRILQGLTRHVLHKESSWLCQVRVTLHTSDSSIPLECLKGDFGDNGPLALHRAPLIPADPLDGSDEAFTQHCQEQCQKQQQQPFVVFMKRGGGITFVEKARRAQASLNASAVVIANTHTVWPYRMQDSQQQSSVLNIPVLLIHHQHLAQVESAISNSATISIELQPHTKQCVICTEPHTIGQALLQMPHCHHIFHEACLMPWLTRHNTCPTCRWELPTSNIEYEQERRRTQRTHAGSNNNHNAQSLANAFYG